MEAIVNWLWQGMALTAVSTLVLHRSPRLSATTRYLVWWVTLVLVLALPLAPRFDWLIEPAVVPSGVSPLTPVPLPDLPAWPLTAAFVCWIGWVAGSLTRVPMSVVALIAARRRVSPFPPEREAALTHWAAVRSHGRPARLALCDRIPAAAVFGLGPAIIAVSPTICARLTDDELDQVILHEWAHVQRRDDFSRLGQIGVRIVAGLHPAVWWIGRRLEIERETACDDFAVNVTGAARRLARCLTKLAEVPPPPMAAPLAPGLASSQLATRVRRLLDPDRNTSTARARGVLGPIAAALVALAASLSQVEIVAAASPPAAVQQRSTTAHPVAASAARADDGRPSGVPASTESAPNAGQSSSSADAPPEIVNHASAETTPRAGDVRETIAAGDISALDRSEWALPRLAMPAPSAPETTPAVSERSIPSDAQAPWDAAADAGIAIGRGSQKAGTAAAEAGVTIGHSSTKAAVATAGFFSRLGRKVGGGF